MSFPAAKTFFLSVSIEHLFSKDQEFVFFVFVLGFFFFRHTLSSLEKAQSFGL